MMPFMINKYNNIIRASKLKILRYSKNPQLRTWFEGHGILKFAR